tara:strand:- start:3321 stop:3599 length:279 start_codon:yes stop_codon:yes gene_type:complete
MRGLLENKKIMFRYRGTGKFAVAKKRRQDEAKERQAYFNELTNTPAKIQEYINNWQNYRKNPIGEKVIRKLAARATKMVNHRKKKNENNKNS